MTLNLFLYFRGELKKAAAIFFAAILLFNSTGLMFFYLLEMQDCKTEAAHSSSSDYDLNTSSLISFVKGGGDFQLLDEKELTSDGALFDIVKTETHDGKVIFYTVKDDKEEGVLQNISQLAKSNSNAGSLPVKNVTPDALKYIGSNESFDVSSIPVQSHFLITIVSDQLFYNSPFRNILSPPPEVFFS